MKKRLSFVLFSAAALGVSTLAYADQGELGVGVKTGFLSFEPPTGSGFKVDSSVPAGITGKYWVNNEVSIEGELVPMLITKGAIKDSSSGTQVAEVNDLSIFGVYAAYNLAIRPNLALRGKAGYVTDKASGTAVSGFTGTENFNGSGLGFGFGIGFKANDKVSVDIDYNILPDMDVAGSTDKIKVSMIGVNIGFSIK